MVLSRRTLLTATGALGVASLTGTASAGARKGPDWAALDASLDEAVERPGRGAGPGSRRTAGRGQAQGEL